MTKVKYPIEVQSPSKSPQSCSLRLRLLQRGKIRVSVLPECEEILISRAGFGGFALPSRKRGRHRDEPTSQSVRSEQHHATSEFFQTRLRPRRPKTKCAAAIIRDQAGSQ